MSRYKHFDEEISGVDGQNALVLPSLDVDESVQVENDATQFQVRTGRRTLIFQYFLGFVRKRTILEVFLLPLVLILLILVLVNAFFSSTRRSKSEEICLSSSCVELSSSISKGLNKSVDPCDDFYEFVCGKWIKSNVVPKGQSSWSTSKELSRKNLIVLKTILEQTNIETKSTEFNAEKETIKFYRSCLNSTEIDRRGLEPMKSFLKTFLNWTIDEWIEIDQNRSHVDFFFDLTRILAGKFGFSYFFTLTVGADEKNSTWNSIHIHQPQLGLGSRDYYLNSSSNERNKIIRETYRNVSVDFLQLIGFSKSQAEKRFDDLFQYESELAKIILPMETLQKPNETYDLMTFKQLNLLFEPINFDFKHFLKEILNLNDSDPIELKDDDKIIVLSVDLMNKTSTFISDYLLSTRKSHVVIDQMIFSLIFDLSSYLSSDFQKVSLPMVKEISGVDSLPERWEYCVTETDATFGYSLGSLYIKSVFSEDDRKKAKEIIETIRQTFEENLGQLNWIDESSRSEAKKKLMKISEKIAYPDFIRNRTVLDQRYLGFTMDEDDFFSNKIKTFQRDRRRSLLNFRKKVDLTEWSMTPRMVNAYYTPSANEIVFPAGILQLPFFHHDLPISLNYGAIGTVIGHEITHGFDDQGREYDADGNMRSWWSKSALEKFEERTKCFVKQYSAFTIDGQSENGQRTLSENIADNGGMKLSFLAYQKNKKRSKSNSPNLRLPGLSYNDDQLFFIGFAHSWCSLENANALYFDLINDPHSPARFRILGTIANSEAFAQTFSCSPTSRMNPSNKCQLW